jgi:hypothetical protein
MGTRWFNRPVTERDCTMLANVFGFDSVDEFVDFAARQQVKDFERQCREYGTMGD